MEIETELVLISDFPKTETATPMIPGKLTISSIALPLL